MDGYAPHLHGILNPPNPGLIYLPQQITVYWYMGKGRFCWEGLENSSAKPSYFYRNNTKFMLNTTGIECNIEIIGEITLRLEKQTLDNVDTESPIYWEIELNPPHEVLSMGTKCPEEKLEVLDIEIVESLNSSGQTHQKGTNNSGQRRRTYY